MRCTLLVEDGLTQVVITPETEFEKKTMEALRPDGNYSFFRGHFHECRGGWVRPYMQRYEPFGNTTEGDDSLILCVRKKEDKGQPESPDEGSDDDAK